MGLYMLWFGLLSWNDEVIPKWRQIGGGIQKHPDYTWFTSRKLLVLGIAFLALATALIFLAAPDFERSALSGEQEVIPPIKWFKILTPW